MVIGKDFIFIRIPKNASTSLATFFVKNYCDDSDIYTSIGDSGIKSTNIPASTLSKYKAQYRFIHLTLNEIIDESIITEDQARAKQVIGVIRDPFERQLSLFFFLNRANKAAATPAKFRQDFAYGYHFHDTSNRIKQVDYLKIGKKSVGEFWNYSRLDHHVAEFVRDHGGKIEHQIQTFKAGIRPDKADLVAEYYDGATRSKVEEYFADDFEVMYENR